MRTNLPVTQTEIPLRDETLIVSRTDLKGRLTYINKDFLEISGFSEKELIGEPHNIVRHPDMPSAAFEDLWATLKAGQPWNGMVKNRCKNGDFYWVEATVTPMQENGRITGYMSVRRKPEAEQVRVAKALYRDINAGKARLRRRSGRLSRLSLATKGVLALAVAVTATLGLAALLLGDADPAQPDSLTHLTQLAMAGALVLAGMGPALFWGIGRLVSGPMAQVSQGLDAISQGQYSARTEIAFDRPDELGQLVRAMTAMQTRIGFEVAETRRVADEGLRLKIGLDNVATNVMLANAQFDIIYMNQSLVRMFETVESDIRKDLPRFDRLQLIGTNIDVFHKHPAHQRGMLARLDGVHRAEIKLGGRTFTLTVTPVVDPQGSRLGYAVEWCDRTGEVRIEGEIAAVIQAAERGDLETRLNTRDLSGFFLNLGNGINGLLESNGRAMQELGDTFRRLADGDLTATLEQRYVGALAETVDNANNTIGRLREIIQSIQLSSDAINTAAKEIATGNQDLSSRTEEQASSLEETASSMEELTTTVKQNADNARTANELAASTQQVALRGGEVVGQVVETMGAIHQSSSKIADIIGVIDGIAFQTNILALNAAVEAARAGEQGRGFAVVATEVRNLAKRSAEAAKEIKGLISDSVEKVAAGSRLVDQAGRTMGEVVASIQRVAKIMAGISSASLEQSSGIEQVNLAVSQMDEVTQQNAALVEEAAAAAESLEEQAHHLVRAVAVFRLADQPERVPAALKRKASEPPGRQHQGERPALKALPASLDDEWQEF